MKKIAVAFLAILIVSAAVSSLNLSLGKETATLTIEPSTQKLSTAQIGQTVQVNITISNVENLWGWGIDDLQFNPSVLNFTKIEEGPFLEEAGQTFFVHKTVDMLNNNIQNIACAIADNISRNGNGILATVTFTIVSAGDSDLTVGNVTLLDQLHNKINCSTANGSIEIKTITAPEFPMWVLFAVLMIGTIFSVALIRGKRFIQPIS
jgi:hypothetical protein